MHDTLWMNLRITGLSGRSQERKHMLFTYICIFICKYKYISNLHTFLETTSYSTETKSRWVVAWAWVREGVYEGGTTKRQQKTCAGPAYVNYLACGDSFTALCNLSHCTLQINAVYFMSILPQQSCLKLILTISFL